MEALVMSDTQTSHTSPAHQADANHRHYDLVASAIHYLRDHRIEQPSLGSLAAALGTSEHHLQRVFSAWAGVSPKRFLQYLTHHHAVQLLREQASVLDTSLATGLSGPGRLHDLTVNCQAMTPGEIASSGAGIDLQWGWGTSPFGATFMAWSSRGICQLSFHNHREQNVVDAYRRDWSAARHQRDDDAAQEVLQRLFATPLRSGQVHLLLRGTNFQLQVWKALIAIPPGQLLSYQQLAEHARVPGASRAVGTAMARNRIAWLIPCHRVIRQTGDFGSYRWGLERKQAMHGWESCR